MKLHLIITDEVKLCLSLMDDANDKIELINALIEKINGETVNVEDFYSTTRDAFLYLTAGERISHLILEVKDHE